MADMTGIKRKNGIAYKADKEFKLFCKFDPHLIWRYSNPVVCYCQEGKGLDISKRNNICKVVKGYMHRIN